MLVIEPLEEKKPPCVSLSFSHKGAGRTQCASQWKTTLQTESGQRSDNRSAPIHNSKDRRDLMMTHKRSLSYTKIKTNRLCSVILLKPPPHPFSGERAAETRRDSFTKLQWTFAAVQMMDPQGLIAPLRMEAVKRTLGAVLYAASDQCRTACRKSSETALLFFKDWSDLTERQGCN